jgi:hypothetical protein
MKDDASAPQRTVVAWRAPFTRALGGGGRACLLVAALAMLLVLLPVGRSIAESFSEEEVRAIFLFNFAVFAEWPPAAFESPESPFRYCALAGQSLRSNLSESLARERVRGRPLILVEAEDPAAWRRCHLLYLEQAARERISQVLAAVSGAPVLTVGDSEAFVRDGGAVALVRKAGRLRTIIDPRAARAAGVQISSKLLRLAILVSGEAVGAAP